VSCDVFLQAGDGHRHFVRQAPFLLPRDPALSRVSRLAAVSEKAAHAITGLLELTFEPSMLWTRYRQGREGTHEAPVENIEEEGSRKANKRQTLFNTIFAYCSLRDLLPSPMIAHSKAPLHEQTTAV
jgi:hypothetical protein